MDRLFPDDVAEEPIEPIGARAAAALRGAAWTAEPARATGYLQAVDADGLVRFAGGDSVVVRMDRGVGEFVVEGTPLVSLAPSDGDPGNPPNRRDARAFNDLFTLASYRTIHQDAAFGVRQMVDIALKALSLTRGQRLRDGSQLRRLPWRRARAGVRPAQTHADLILKAAEPTDCARQRPGGGDWGARRCARHPQLTAVAPARLG